MLTNRIDIVKQCATTVQTIEQGVSRGCLPPTGDIWGNCGSDAYHMEHYRNVDNTMRAYPEIAANWKAAGISADKWVAFYCGTGWRERDLVLRLPDGLATDRRIRRRLVRVEPGSDRQPDRGGGARRRLVQDSCPAPWDDSGRRRWSRPSSRTFRPKRNRSSMDCWANWLDTATRFGYSEADSSAND
jgi:hypothetical protein